MTDALDEALEAISRTAPQIEGGNTNHAPMVAETLVTIGHGHRVLRWVDAYRRQVGTQERPSDRPPIEGDWREGLGNARLWPEWVGHFRRELNEHHWTDVLEAWIPRLAPGLSGEATHGLIRTAHAVRALGDNETEPRRRELGDGLAYWAATYHAFGPAPPEPRHLGLNEALSRVPVLKPDTSGNIDDTLRRLDDSPEFGPVVNLLATGTDPLKDLSALTERFAGVYLANAQDPARTFAVVHAVTGPSALRLLAPQVSKSTLELLLLYAWQAAAAIYGVWAIDRTAPKLTGESISSEYLTEASVANGAAHAIKFVEACLREYEHNPAPVYLEAAADAAKRLSG